MSDEERAWENCAHEYRTAEGCLKNYERIFFTSNTDAMYNLVMAGDFIFHALDAPEETRVHHIQKAKVYAEKAQQEALFATLVGIYAKIDDLQKIVRSSSSLKDERVIAEFHKKYEALQGDLAPIKKIIKRFGDEPDMELPKLTQLKHIIEKASQLYILHETYARDIKRIVRGRRRRKILSCTFDILCFIVSFLGVEVVKYFICN